MSDGHELVSAPAGETRTTLMRLKFAEFYLETGNAREAARRAGYQGTDRALDGVASRLLKREDVGNLLTQHLRKLLAPEEAHSILADIARSSIADFVKIDSETGQITGFDFASERAQAKLHTIKKLKFTKMGPEIELYDKLSAVAIVVKNARDDDPTKANRRAVEAFLNMLPETVREQVLRSIADSDDVIEGEASEPVSVLTEVVKPEELAWLKELQQSAESAAETPFGEEEDSDG